MDMIINHRIYVRATNAMFVLALFLLLGLLSPFMKSDEQATDKRETMGLVVRSKFH